MRSPISSEAARPIGALLLLLAAAGFGCSVQSQAQTQTKENRDEGLIVQVGQLQKDVKGLNAQVGQLQKDVKGLRDELAARTIDWYDQREHATELPAPVSVTDGWESPSVSLQAREGDLIRVFVHFFAAPKGTGFHWSVKAAGNVSSKAREPAGGSIPSGSVVIPGWQSQSSVSFFKAYDDGKKEFKIKVSKGDDLFDGNGEISMLVIIAENLGKR